MNWSLLNTFYIVNAKIPYLNKNVKYKIYKLSFIAKAWVTF